jgi:hypothetical protein
MGSDAFDKWAFPMERPLRQAGYPERFIQGLMELCWEAVKGHSNYEHSGKKNEWDIFKANKKIVPCPRWPAAECVLIAGKWKCKNAPCMIIIEIDGQRPEGTQ